MNAKEQVALERLIAIAQGDTGHSRQVASFLACVVECRKLGLLRHDNNVEL
jgi:hypothetical protein